MNSPETILKQYWGYDVFRPLQKEIISSVLDNKDTLALLPTGGGKSVCYQIPALMKEGLCLVVSPLIALMQDQVMRLKQLNIPAACLHAGMHYNDVKRTLDNAVEGGYKLLYVSPERLQTQLFTDYLPEFPLDFIAVDEAHCISQWGHDFRPDYMKIVNLKEIFPSIPILALTASATAHVQDDIVKQLELRSPAIFRESVQRANIFYEIKYSENKSADTLDGINTGCAIIYCRSRKQTEALQTYLQERGVAATAYHAGMAKEKREAAQELWMTDKAPVIAATTAFGMGIDKADVRTVLHYDAPEHIEAYYQETGRAGRDGAASRALALYNSSDIKRLEDSITLQFPPQDYLRQVYQSVTEYLEIPTGTQPDRYFPFELNDFCKKFSLQSSQAVHALKLLEREGLWTLTESVYRPATAQFHTDRHTLDELQQTHPRLGYVTVGLLRMYGTIFHFPTPIRPGAIAKQLKMSMEELEQALRQLHKMGLLEYSKPGEGPQLFFHHLRVDSRHLLLNMERINTLRKHHEARTDAMLAFLQNDSVCRERLLRDYFGEQHAGNCGHCDICAKKNAKKINSKELRAELLMAIQQHGSISLQKLIAPYPDAIKEQALSLLREMLDENIIQLKENNVVNIK